MILDTNLTFIDKTDVFSATGANLVGDVVDLDSTGRDFLDTLYFVVQITTSFVGASAQVQFVLASDAQAAITTTGAETRHILTEFRNASELLAGQTFIVPLPGGSLQRAERYMGVITNTVTAATTAGAISAFLVNDPQNWAAYADAVN